MVDLVRQAAALGISLPTEAEEQFQVYLDTLLLWRRRLSLTTASSPEQIIYRHILDSLAIIRFVKVGFRIADLGSGAGFPGIPVAICCPTAQVVLIESRRKRASFLREVVRKTRLPNAEVVEGRAEGQLAIGRFDMVAARAVGPSGELLTMSAPLLRTGGLAIAMKGPRGLTEGTAVGTEFHGPEIYRYSLPGDVRRVLLVYHRR